MLLASPNYGSRESLPLFVESSPVWSLPILPAPVALYVSPHNTGAKEALRVLSDTFAQIRPVTELAPIARWLLFLSPGSFEGPHGVPLAVELAAALKSGVAPVVLWDSDVTNEFAVIIESTPRSLAMSGLFKPLAIEWRGGVHRSVSVQRAAKALGAQDLHQGCHRRWCTYVVRPKLRSVRTLSLVGVDWIRSRVSRASRKLVGISKRDRESDCMLELERTSRSTLADNDQRVDEYEMTEQ